MAERPSLTELREMLARLYDNEESARRVVYDARIPSGAIQFGTSATDNWQAILSHAEKHDMVLAVVNVALKDFPNRRDLRAAKDMYEATQSSMEKHRLTARIFFILCDYSSRKLADLIALQNERTSLFQIRVAESWSYWSGKAEAEAELQSTSATERHTGNHLSAYSTLYDYCEVFHKFIDRCNYDTHLKPLDGIDIAITSNPFPCQEIIFAWNTRDRQAVVINLSRYNPILVDKAVIRLIQRSLIYCLNITDLEVHRDNRRCFFDWGLVIDQVDLCSQCSTIIKQELGQVALDELRKWLNNSF